MARTSRRVNFKATVSDPTDAAWESLCWVAAHYFSVTGEHHTFAPVINNKDRILPEASKRDWTFRKLYNLKTIKERTSYIMTALNKAIQETKEHPVPESSSPHHTPRVNLTMTTPDGRKWIWNFFAIYAARRAVDYLIQDRPTKWINDNTLVIFARPPSTQPMLTITTDAKPDGLTDIMEHTFTARELAYSLPADKYRIGAEMFAPPPPVDYATSNDRPSRLATDSSSPSTPRLSKADKPAKASKPSGLIPLPTILSDTDIDAREARQALRKTNTPKPSHGRWEWSPNEIDTIKASIIAAVTKMRKKK